MKRQRHFILLFIAIGLIFSLTTLTKAQKTTDVLHQYSAISSLPMEQRQKFFRDLSNEDKAGIFRFHLAFQLTKRPLLSKQQKELIVEIIPNLTPESYDRTNPELTAKTHQAAQLLEQKAMTLFSRQEGSEIFATLGGSEQDVITLKQYESLEAYSLSDRKAIFRKASAEGKATLWKIHLTYFLALETGFTDSQRSLIMEVMSTFTPEVYAISRDTPQWKQQDEINRGLQAKILQLFSKEKAVEIFATLGPSKNIPTINLFEGSDCSCCASCWLSWSCPVLNNTCRTGDCTTKDRGCGFAGQYGCDGKCKFDG